MALAHVCVQATRPCAPCESALSRIRVAAGTAAIFSTSIGADGALGGLVYSDAVVEATNAAGAAADGNAKANATAAGSGGGHVRNGGITVT